jgi:RNA recognition motif-containing protein
VCTDRVSGQSHGSGFCKFDSEGNMKTAIKEMNGIEVNGRAINVNAAKAAAFFTLLLSLTSSVHVSSAPTRPTNKTQFLAPTAVPWH